MEKWIYKITNQINGKVYIGQTNNLERRYKEHWFRYDREQPLYQAFNKYGRENFKMEPIELTENYNEREQYWIAFYDSYNKGGYNATKGGEENSQSSRINEILLKHYEDILYEIAWTQNSLNSICKKYKFSDPVVDKINLGGYSEQFSSDYIFPIRKTGNALSQYLVETLQNEILGKLSFKEIQEKYNIGHQFLADLNAGRKYRNNSLKYPLRKVNPIPKSIVLEIEALLLTKEEILDKYNISVKDIIKIQTKTHQYSS